MEIELALIWLAACAVGFTGWWLMSSWGWSYEEAAADLAARVAHESASQDVEGCRPSDSAPDPWEYTKSLLPCGDLAAW